MPKKILVLSASVGAGHMRAAQAVELALREVAPDAMVKNLDVLTLTNTAFRKIYGEAYLDFVNKAPHVLGFFYDLMDRPRRADSKRDLLRRTVEKINLSKLCDILQCDEWDAIVNTHFLPAEIISMLRKKRKIHTPHMTVTTDFETHRLWINQPCDRYTTATDEGAAYLAHWGVPRETIDVTGIPIHPAFAKSHDRAMCLKKHGLVGDRPIVLQLAGGFGVGPIQRIFESILSLEQPLEVVVVAGKNEKVRKQLAAIKPPKQHRVKVIGFTTDMHELMTAADLVVTKPGGLTSSEVLACGAAMAIVNPIPGQETRNSDYLLESGAAIKINNLGTLGFRLSKLLAMPEELARLKQNARRIAKPRAAYDVARIALGLAR
jgi:processive 1,2-diacylglycerol beta-glucosyltransferase